MFGGVWDPFWLCENWGSPTPFHADFSAAPGKAQEAHAARPAKDAASWKKHIPATQAIVVGVAFLASLCHAICVECVSIYVL